MPEIIRLGDSTSHGGKVIEGSPFDICMGKPIAFMGHKVQCPKCKGVFPIVEGASTTTFYGKGVALAGMKTACGAVLIASQFTDIVEFGGGSAATNNASKTANSAIANPAAASTGSAPSTKPDSPDDKFDDRFVLQDADTGEPIPFAEYAIRRESGEIEYGTTDADGRTHLLSATAKAEVIEIYA
ncbi:PAAR domain-containing protein [Massilia sp. UBA6681]|uniref:PAAR domain-containing protein n=1 Tax=Massilia sp. UBA6681 TaxID=1946839 RepID=UPI0025C05648|nr:PAAR domain-containing protein [Massilia sp. UBA6681]